MFSPKCDICNDSGVMIVSYAHVEGGHIVDEESDECVCQKIADENEAYELMVDNSLNLQ